MDILEIILIIIAYLIGSLSSAIIVCKIMGLPDPRSKGSGNPAAGDLDDHRSLSPVTGDTDVWHVAEDALGDGLLGLPGQLGELIEGAPGLVAGAHQVVHRLPVAVPRRREQLAQRRPNGRFVVLDAFASAVVSTIASAAGHGQSGKRQRIRSCYRFQDRHP